MIPDDKLTPEDKIYVRMIAAIVVVATLIAVILTFCGCVDYRFRFASGFNDAYFTHRRGEETNVFHFDHSNWIRTKDGSYHRLHRDGAGRFYYMDWNERRQRWMIVGESEFFNACQNK
jgi:hypothetical protein